MIHATTGYKPVAYTQDGKRTLITDMAVSKHEEPKNEASKCGGGK